MEALRRLSADQRRRAYEEVFREAFPPQELKPLEQMERMIAAGEYDFFGLMVDDVPTGFVCCWRWGDAVLIDYLCVAAAARCGGIGGRTLELAIAAYPAGTVILGEVEAPTGDPARDAMILRRLDFYTRHGARTLDYDCALFGVHYKTIAWGGEDLSAAELLQRHDAIYRHGFSPALYADAVQMPLRAGEPLRCWEAWADRPEHGGEET